MLERKDIPASENPPRARRRRLPAVGLTVFILLCAVVVYWPIQDEEVSTAGALTKQVASITVTETTARLNDWPVEILASGAVEPWQEAIIGAQVNGARLAELHVATGDTVQKNQVLANFDTDVLQAEIVQARAALRQAKAQADQARANRNRALKLKDSGSISEQDLLQLVTEAETALSQMESSHAQLATRELQLRYATVVSPDDGVISARSATIGAIGTPGDELFRLIRQNRLEWRGELTATQLGEVSVGQIVTLGLPDGQVAKAKIRQIAPSLDPLSRLGKVYADILPGSSARPGMYAQARIMVTVREALTVPAESIVMRDGHSHVFRLISDGSNASLHAVEIGRRQANGVEILQGLREGDRVIVQGAGFLNDGDRVRVVSAAVELKPTTSTVDR